MELTALTTYQALVYQSRANRVIRAHIEDILHEHNLTMMQWSVLGFIKDAGKHGTRISDLAEQLDTSLAFITNSVNALEAKGIVYRVGHETDNRAKLVCVAPAYRKVLNEIETELSKRMYTWLKQHIDASELQTHMKVLHDIALIAD